MSDDGFREALREKDPRLVEAVEIFGALRKHPMLTGARGPEERELKHPEIWVREVGEPRRRAIREAAKARWQDVDSPSSGLVAELAEFRARYREAGGLLRLVRRLEDLGWVWLVSPDGTPLLGPGGGEWMPHRKGEYPKAEEVIGYEPAEDEGTWEAFDIHEGRWVPVDGTMREATTDERRRRFRPTFRLVPVTAPRVKQGISLFRAVVEALYEALDLESVQDEKAKRRRIAEYLPEVFAGRRDESPRGPIARALSNFSSR